MAEIDKKDEVDDKEVYAILDYCRKPVFVGQWGQA